MLSFSLLFLTRVAPSLFHNTYIIMHCISESRYILIAAPISPSESQFVRVTNLSHARRRPVLSSFSGRRLTDQLAHNLFYFIEKDYLSLATIAELNHRD